jgi:hypothetical protein
MKYLQIFFILIILFGCAGRNELMTALQFMET